MANGTTILDAEVATRNVPKRLRELHAAAPQSRGHPRETKANWADLARAFGQLRYLDVTGWMMGRSCGVRDALGTMSLLETLRMSKCGLSGDEAAFAVTSHPALQYVVLLNNSVGTAGLSALCRWESARRIGYRQAVVDRHGS